MVNQNYFSIFVSFLLLLLLCSSIETPYKRIVHNLDPEAKCLDGSPGAMYIN